MQQTLLKMVYLTKKYEKFFAKKFCDIDPWSEFSALDARVCHPIALITKTA
jgi:hypothetical protein